LKQVLQGIDNTVFPEFSTKEDKKKAVGEDSLHKIIVQIIF